MLQSNNGTPKSSIEFHYGWAMPLSVLNSSLLKLFIYFPRLSVIVIAVHWHGSLFESVSSVRSAFWTGGFNCCHLSVVLFLPFSNTGASPLHRVGEPSPVVIRCIYSILDSIAFMWIVASWCVFTIKWPGQTKRSDWLTETDSRPRPRDDFLYTSTWI